MLLKRGINISIAKILFNWLPKNGLGGKWLMIKFHCSYLQAGKS